MTGKSVSTPAKTAGFRIVTLEDFLADNSIKPRKELLGPWLTERGLALLYAPTGIGKSWFAMGIAAAVASGGPFAGFRAPAASRVLYIDGEMDPADLQFRLGMISAASEGTEEGLVWRNLTLFARHHQPASTTFPNFGDPGARDTILRAIKRQQSQLVVLDNLSTLSSVSDENAAEAWDPVLELLQDIKRLGAAVLVVHHSNKAGASYRGSSKIAVLFDTIMCLKPDGEALSVNGAAFVWSFEKARMLGVELRKGVSGRLENGRWAWETRYDEELAALVDRLRNGEFTSQTDMAQKVGVSKGQISKQLRRAEAAGLMTPADRRAWLQEAREEARAAGEAHADF